jgi:hypothetical protein
LRAALPKRVAVRRMLTERELVVDLDVVDVRAFPALDVRGWNVCDCYQPRRR